MATQIVNPKSLVLVMTSLYNCPSVRSTVHVSQHPKCRIAGTRVFGGMLNGLELVFFGQRTAFDTAL